MVSKMRRLFALLLLCLSLSTPALWAGEPPEEPILRLETGRHTAKIKQVASDAKGRWLATASNDKTLRLWDSASGELLHTWRLPIGIGHEGKLYAVAMDPAGVWIAAGGWTGYEWDGKYSIYILDRASGRLLQRLDGLENAVFHLCTSADGRWLAATLGNKGVRIFDAKDNFRQLLADSDYGGDSAGCAFSPDSQRLVTSSFDGQLRLYHFIDGGFKHITGTQVNGGKRPRGVAFHPDGERIAVGFNDTTAVQVVDGEDLSLRYTANTTGINNGSLSSVAWSGDGARLFAGGMYDDGGGNNPVLSWSKSGRGRRSAWSAADSTVVDLTSLPDGRLAVVTADPALLLFDHQGSKLFDLRPHTADLRNQDEHFRISTDGQQLAFGLKPFGKKPVWFDLNSRRLQQGKVNTTTLIQASLLNLGYNPGAIDGQSGPKTRAAAAAYRLENDVGGKGLDRRLQQSLGITPLAPPRIKARGLNITNWKSKTNPSLNSRPLALRQDEISRSLAIAPDGRRFLLGASWFLRLFDDQGKVLWRQSTPDIAWGVNMSADGRLAVAAFGDGAIRWYRMSDGKHLLSLFVTNDAKEWVLWSPSGYFDASPGGDRLIGSHVNNGKDKVADFYSAAQMRERFYRPKIITHVLTELDEEEAFAIKPKFYALTDQYWQEANALSKQGQYLEAARMYEKAVEAEQASPEPRQGVLVNLFNNDLGSNYFRGGQYDKAIEHYQQALEIVKRLGVETGVSTILSHIGVVYSKWGKYDKAIEYYQQALEINRMLGKEAEVAVTLSKIGTAYDAWGRHDKAIDNFQQALEIDRRLGKQTEIAILLNNIGSAYNSLSKYGKAIEHYQQALEIDMRLGKETAASTRLSNIGAVYFKWGQYDKAIEYFQQALEIDKRLGMETGVSDLLSIIGVAYSKLGQYDKAIEHYQQALEIDKNLGKEGQVTTRLLEAVGFAYNAWSQYGKAIEYYQQALEINRMLGKEAEVAATLSSIGTVYGAWGQHDKAIDNLQQALEIERRLGKEALVATRLNYIGRLYSSWSQYDKAIEHYQQALEINRRLGKKSGIARNFNDIGTVHSAWGQYDKAIEYYQQALEVGRMLGEGAEVAASLSYIGSVYFAWGQHDKAIDNFQQALEIDRRLGKEASVAIRLRNIGEVYDSWGQYDKAVDIFQQALEINRMLGKEASVAILLNKIGGVYYSWGQYDKAMEHYQQALEIDNKLGRDENVAASLSNIGTVYGVWGQYDKAFDNFQKGLEIDRRLGKDALVAIHLSKIGEVYGSRGQYDKAIDNFQQALEINRRLGIDASVAIQLRRIGMVYLNWGQYDKVIEHYQQALEIDRRLGRESEIADSLSKIGAIYIGRGQYSKAIDYLRESIQLKEKIRKTATGDIRRDYLASQISTYQFLAAAFLRNDDPRGVLDAIEQSRARLLAERIAGIDSEMETPSLEEVQKSLAVDEAVLLFSNIDHDNFILMVITANEIAMEEIPKESFLAKSKMQYKKPILMLLEKQRGLIPIVSKEGEQAFEKKQQQADFETAVHYYRTLLTNPEKQQESRDFGRLLHALLIEPAREKLVGKTKITIMPDGILGFLPFETLVDENNNYLVQKYDLRYTQSLTIDKLLQGRDYTNNNRRKPLLAMGGAVYEPITASGAPIDNTRQLALLQQETDKITEEKRSARNAYGQLGYGNWSNLPGTLEEVNELSAIIKDGDTLIGDKVTENRIKQYSNSGKLAQYKVLHFATHGLVVPELPALSAIVLSQFKNEKEGEDGYLRMGEIAELDLSADFVNLSACETGLGKIVGGEGIVGLTQSFLIAGANGLSVSLWQVADESTARFMTELYTKVQTSGIGYREALTEVKRGFINGDYGEQWRSPYYWSPFVYYGN